MLKDKQQQQQQQVPCLLEDEVIKKIAEHYARTPAQILIRFHLERGLCVIPKSQDPIRLAQNLDSLNFSLQPEDMDKLLQLNRNFRFVTFDLLGLLHHPQHPFKQI